MIGVVFVSYRIPATRLAEHWAWNGSLYDMSDTRVFAVVDQASPMPDYATALVYPNSLPVFSLAKTKNHGIRAAIEEGCDPICVIDVDMCWTLEAFYACQNVPENVLLRPITKMAVTHRDRKKKSHNDYGMGCCVCARGGHWMRSGFDERFQGYGAEDWQIIKTMGRAGVRLERREFVYHIAHDPSVSQVNQGGSGRPDCWNRGTINPDNSVLNNELVR